MELKMMVEDQTQYRDIEALNMMIRISENLRKSESQIVFSDFGTRRRFTPDSYKMVSPEIRKQVEKVKFPDGYLLFQKMNSIIPEDQETFHCNTESEQLPNGTWRVFRKNLEVKDIVANNEFEAKSEAWLYLHTD